MSDSNDVIEIIVKLPKRQHRAVEQISVIIDNGASIDDFYREAIYPILSAIGFGTRTIIVGACDFYTEMRYLLMVEQADRPEKSNVLDLSDDE